jgi:hypothetical protein
MRFYLDTEFIERGYEKIELISIGMVAANGSEFYAIADDGWEESHASQWVKDNVLVHLGDTPRVSRKVIQADILNFVDKWRDPKPEFWGYYSDYDWVLFCQLFGTMMDLPKDWPMFCMDVKQLCMTLGNPKLPQQAGSEHNALCDARHIRNMHEWLMAYGSGIQNPFALSGKSF